MSFENVSPASKGAGPRLPSLTILIVNFGEPYLTINCVNSLLATGLEPNHVIAVVDNKSPDNSYAILQKGLPERVRLLQTCSNEGFAAGVNFGASLVPSDYILILNPDTVFTDRSYLRALEFAHKDSSVGVVGLDLRYKDGSRQHSARTFYSASDLIARRLPLGPSGIRSKISRRHLMVDKWEMNKPFRADWVVGTGMIARKSVFDELHGMDKSYFLYFEDVDFCVRASKLGYSVFGIPGASLVHDHQRSSFRSPLSWHGRTHIRSFLRFVSKYGLPVFSRVERTSIR